MTIKTNQEGFTAAELHTTFSCQMKAVLLDSFIGDPPLFKVHMVHQDFAWSENCCYEAAEFFTRLADELRRIRDKGLNTRYNDEAPF